MDDQIVTDRRAILEPPHRPGMPYSSEIVFNCECSMFMMSPYDADNLDVSKFVYQEKRYESMDAIFKDGWKANKCPVCRGIREEL